MIPLLILLVPVLAALPILFGGRSASASRLPAAGTAIVQLLLVVGALATFPSQSEMLDVAERESMWAPVERFILPLGTLDAGSVSYTLSFYVGIDGLALPFLLLMILAFSATALMLWRERSPSRHQCSLLLLLNACATGVLVSHDGLQLLIFLGGALFTITALAGTWRGYEGVAAARRFLPVAFGATIVLGVALAGANPRSDEVATNGIAENRTFELPALTDMAARDFRAGLLQEGEPRGSVQSDAFRGALFTLLLCACGALMMIFPLHPVGGNVIDSSSPAVSQLLLILLPLLGLYLLIRVPLLLFPTFAYDQFWRGLIAGAGCVTAIYASIVGLGERRPMRILRYVVIAWSGLSLPLLFSFERAWLGAALSGFFLCGVCTIALALLINRVNREIGGEHAVEVRGLRRVVPRWSLLFGIGASLLSLLPPLIVGMILFHTGDMHARPELEDSPEILWIGWIVLALVGGILAALSAARMDLRLLFGDYPASIGTLVPFDMDRRALYRGIAAMILVGILAVAIVVFINEVSAEMIQRLIDQKGAVQT